LLLLVGCQQATEVPTFVEIKGHGTESLEGVWSVALSPDGKKIVTGGGDETARIWDAETQKELHVLKGHRDAVASVAFSPDGKKVITVAAGIVRFWDTESGKEMQNLEGHKDVGSHVSVVAFSSDGKKILTACFDKFARIWDAESLKEIQKKEHPEYFNTAANSPDGKHIVTGCGAFTDSVRIWNAESGKELHKFGNNATSIAFSPDGKQFLVAYLHTKAFCIYDTESGKELHKQAVQVNRVTNFLRFGEHTNWVNSAAFSPDGKKIVTGDYEGNIQIWSADLKEKLRTWQGHRGPVDSVAFSSDGKKIISASIEHGTARIWDLSAMENP
jgi:WD40 repeat protein